MEKGLVSFIVVSYNQAVYIEECLNSILLQTYTNWELILADDFSTDNSKDIFDAWIKNNKIKGRVVTQYNTSNLGLCKTVNKCLSFCNGEYIKLIAADDFLHENFLSGSVKLMQNDNSIGAVYSDAYIINESSVVQKEKFLGTHRKYNSGWIFKDLIQDNFIPAATLIIKSETYKKLGAYDEEIWIEDWEYSLRMSKFYQIAYTGLPLAFYRRHDANIGSDKNLRLTPAIWKILVKYDPKGKYRSILNWRAKHMFFIYPDRNFAITLYENYKFHNKILLFCLRFRIPEFIYKGFAKVFGD